MTRLRTCEMLKIRKVMISPTSSCCMWEMMMKVVMMYRLICSTWTRTVSRPLVLDSEK